MTPRTPRADSARNHEALLDAGARALRGNVDATLEDIATEAGLSRRAVYGHFSGRDALVDAVVVRGAQRIADAVGPSTDEDPLVALARLGGALWDAVADVHAVARMALASGRGATVAGAMAPIRERVRACLVDAVSAHRVRTDVAPEVVALLVERAALDVLEVARQAQPDVARMLAMTHPLCAAGVGADDAARLASQAEETR